MSHTKKGFTLIELLVVIAIISLLTSIVMVSLNIARQKGRDAERISALRQVKTALELYRSENATYPISTGTAVKDMQGMSAYIPNLPSDPRPSFGQYYYQSSDGRDYGLFFRLESTPDPLTEGFRKSVNSGYIFTAPYENYNNATAVGW